MQKRKRSFLFNLIFCFFLLSFVNASRASSVLLNQCSHLGHKWDRVLETFHC